MAGKNSAVFGIYHDRPSICHRFVAGSKKCKELRRERGVDP